MPSAGKVAGFEGPEKSRHYLIVEGRRKLVSSPDGHESVRVLVVGQLGDGGRERPPPTPFPRGVVNS